MTSASDVLQPGGIASASCTFTQVFGSFYADFAMSAPAAGWKVRVRAGGVDSGWQSAATSIRLPYAWTEGPVPVEFWLQAPANAVAGTSTATRMSARGCLLSSCFGAGVADSSTLDARIAPLGSDDMSMSCSPAGTLTVGRGTTGTITCQVNALSGLGGTSLIVRSVAIPAPPGGWTMTTSPAGSVGAGGAVTISPGQALAAGQSWSFTLSLSPACTANASASLRLSTTVANTNGATTGANVAGPSATIAASAGTPSQTMSASVVGSSLQWAFTYSFDEQVGTGSLTYQVAVAGCAGWNVSMTARPFAYSGTSPGASLAASNVRLKSAGQPTVVSGSGTGLTPGISIGGIDTPRKVLSASAGNGHGTYQQEVMFAVNVPGSTPVGTYRTTITITTAVGP